MSTYQESIFDGLTAMREWAAKQTEPLPDDPWKLPKDCPLWSMGLSMAQAAGILASVRRRSETVQQVPHLDDGSEKWKAEYAHMRDRFLDLQERHTRILLSGLLQQKEDKTLGEG